VVNRALFDKVPYDPLKDFDPVTLAVTTPMVLVVHASLPVATLKDLIAVIVFCFTDLAHPDAFGGA